MMRKKDILLACAALFAMTLHRGKQDLPAEGSHQLTPDLESACQTLQHAR
jgi:hypothetical protein